MQKPQLLQLCRSAAAGKTNPKAKTGTAALGSVKDWCHNYDLARTRPFQELSNSKAVMNVSNLRFPHRETYAIPAAFIATAPSLLIAHTCCVLNVVMTRDIRLLVGTFPLAHSKHTLCCPAGKPSF